MPQLMVLQISTKELVDLCLVGITKMLIVAELLHVKHYLELVHFVLLLNSLLNSAQVLFIFQNQHGAIIPQFSKQQVLKLVNIDISNLQLVVLILKVCLLIFQQHQKAQQSYFTLVHTTQLVLIQQKINGSKFSKFVNRIVYILSSILPTKVLPQVLLMMTHGVFVTS